MTFAGGLIKTNLSLKHLENGFSVDVPGYQRVWAFIGGAKSYVAAG